MSDSYMAYLSPYLQTILPDKHRGTSEGPSPVLPWVSSGVYSLFLSKDVTLVGKLIHATYILALIHACLCFSWRHFKILYDSSAQLSHSSVCTRQTDSLFKLCDKEK